MSVSRGQGYQAHRPQRESAGRSHRLKNRAWDISRRASYREGRSQLPCPLITRLPQSATSNISERSPPAAGTNALTWESVSPQKAVSTSSLLKVNKLWGDSSRLECLPVHFDLLPNKQYKRACVTCNQEIEDTGDSKLKCSLNDL